MFCESKQKKKRQSMPVKYIPSRKEKERMSKCCRAQVQTRKKGGGELVVVMTLKMRRSGDVGHSRVQIADGFNQPQNAKV